MLVVLGHGVVAEPRLYSRNDREGFVFEIHMNRDGEIFGLHVACGAGKHTRTARRHGSWDRGL